MDPFLKAFLSKKSMSNANNTASNESTKLSRNHFSQRNSSQQVAPSGLTGKISESLINQIQGQTAKSKMQDDRKLGGMQAFRMRSPEFTARSLHSVANMSNK